MTSAYPPHDRGRSADVDARVMLAAAEVLTAERERVLRGAHDDVLDELLAASMAITALTHSVEPALRLQLDDALEALERAVALLRTTLLQQAPTSFDRLRPSTVLTEAADATVRVLGFTPALRLDDAVDSIADPQLLGHLIVSMRELVGNVARHAAAAAVIVTVRVDDDVVELEVADDGIGLAPDHDPGTGFASLRSRAEQLGGVFEVVVPPTPSGGRGTVTRWRVPRRRDRQ